MTLGPGFLVNTTTAGIQVASANAISSNGTSVAVWTSYSNPSPGIRGQRFDASGAKLGSEFSVPIVGNVNGAGIFQWDPSVAMDNAGDFVVSWTEREANGDTNVVAQKFRSDGVPVNGAVQVGVGTFLEDDSHVAMNALGGDFVVSYTRDTNNNNPDIYAKRYNASSQLVGVITVEAGPEADTNSSISMVANGNFDIAFEALFDPTEVVIFVKQYSASGGLLATIPIATSGIVDGGTSISVDDFGDGVVAYNQGYPGVNLIEAKRFSPTGVLGATTDFSASGFNTFPSVALRVGGGPYVIAHQDASNHVDVTEVNTSGTVVANWVADAMPNGPGQPISYTDAAISINALDQFLVTDTTFNPDPRDEDILGHFGNLSLTNPLIRSSSVASDLAPTSQPVVASATRAQSSPNTAGLTTLQRPVVNTTWILPTDASKAAGGTGGLLQGFPRFSVTYRRRSGARPYGDRVKTPTQPVDQRPGGPGCSPAASPNPVLPARSHGEPRLAKPQDRRAVRRHRRAGRRSVHARRDRTATEVGSHRSDGRIGTQSRFEQPSFVLQSVDTGAVPILWLPTKSRRWAR